MDSLHLVNPHDQESWRLNVVVVEAKLPVGDHPNLAAHVFERSGYSQRSADSVHRERAFHPCTLWPVCLAAECSGQSACEFREGVFVCFQRLPHIAVASSDACFQGFEIDVEVNRVGFQVDLACQVR